MFKKLSQSECYATYRGVTEDGVIILFHPREGYPIWALDIQVWDAQRGMKGEWIKIPEALKNALDKIHVSQYGVFPDEIACNLSRDQLYNF